MGYYCNGVDVIDIVFAKNVEVLIILITIGFYYFISYYVLNNIKTFTYSFIILYIRYLPNISTIFLTPPVAQSWAFVINFRF